MELLLKQIRCALAPREGQHHSSGGTAGRAYECSVTMATWSFVTKPAKGRERSSAHTVRKETALWGSERDLGTDRSLFFFNHLLGLPKFPFHCTRINIRRYITACMHISIQSRGGGQFVRSLYILGTCVRQRLTCGKKRILCTTKSIQIRNQHCPLSGKEKKRAKKKVA